MNAMLIVVIEREALPSGPHQARMIIRDHLGNRYRTPKVTFKDGNVGSPDGPQPSTPPASRPDLSDPLNRPTSSLPPKPPARLRRQTGGPIDPS